MVIDRLQLYIFFIVTTAGTIGKILHLSNNKKWSWINVIYSLFPGILMDAPHIFEYVDQDKIIEIYRGK